MKKLLLILLMIIVIYGIGIFIFPNLFDRIDAFFGVSIHKDIRGLKTGLDDISTKIPNGGKLGKTISGALDIKDKIIDTSEKTKDKLDEVRIALSGAEDTYNKAKQTVTDAKDTLNDIQKVGESIMNIVNTGAVQ